MDDNGNAMYNWLLPKPTLRFEGTTKIHGTNAGVIQSHDGELWCQSSIRIITPECDNAGFAMFAHNNELALRAIITNAKSVVASSQLCLYDCAVFGEWCGRGIQSNVAVNELPKMFVIFGIAFVDDEGEKTYLTRDQVTAVCKDIVQVPRGVIPDATNIYCIYDFQTFTIDIDFENPHEAVNELNAIATRIGDECPVGKAFGVSGIGEGTVIRCVTTGYENSGFWAKIKDERHSKSKVRTLATVNVERINDIKELADKLAHEGRVRQQFDLTFDTINGGTPDITKMGEFIKSVMKDIVKEELDVIAASGFTVKEIAGPVSTIVRNFMLTQLNTF